MSHYERYFNRYQTGRGINDIGPVYRATHHIQRGRGLSGILSTIIKYISPFLLSSTKAIGQEALRSGSEILQNLGNKPIADLIKGEAMRSGKSLADRTGRTLKKMSDEMSGEGIKRKKVKMTRLINSLERLSTTPSRKRRKKKQTKKSSAKSSTKTTKARTKTKTGKKVIVRKKKKTPANKKAKTTFLRQYLLKK